MPSPALTLVESQPLWPAQFEAAAGELRSAFAQDAVPVEHIGSTAVPGLCAKPVLDVLLGAGSLALVESRAPALAELGYVYRPEYESVLPERRYFVRPAGALPRIHLHAVVHGGLLWKRHLFFRDALRAHPELAGEYARLKRALAALHAGDKAAYTEAKSPFIARVLAACDPTSTGAREGRA